MTGKQDIPELCLSLFPYLAENLDKRAGLLSGGQQQQLAIARALGGQSAYSSARRADRGHPGPTSCTRSVRRLGRLNKEFGITLILTEQHIKVARKAGRRLS